MEYFEKGWGGRYLTIKHVVIANVSAMVTTLLYVLLPWFLDGCNVAMVTSDQRVQICHHANLDQRGEGPNS